MDKLELDARVARLERSLTFLWSLVALGMASVGVFLFFAVTSYGTRAAPPQVATAQPHTATVVARTVAPPGARTLADVERELLVVKDLKGRLLITDQEYAAKVKQILQPQFVSVDLKADLEKIRDLSARLMLTDADRDRLKTQVLGVAP
jgi:hypothetical protein